ncbi:MAG: S9 family peptidase [Kiritimatiellae bacterium]|nr:S9 family peptidase [Kiritimatiellia bacterium]
MKTRTQNKKKSGGDAATVQQTYREAPKEIAAWLDAPWPARASVDPTGRWLLLMDRQRLTRIANLATQPELRLAGLLIDPNASAISWKSDGPLKHEVHYHGGLTLKHIETGRTQRIRGLPADSLIGPPHWAPDGSKLAFAVRQRTGLTLWVVDMESLRPRRVTDVKLNGVFGDMVAWMPDSERLMCATIPRGRSRPPRPPVRTRPEVRESGQGRSTSFYEELLRNAEDEALFAYYARAQLAVVSTGGSLEPLGAPGYFWRVALAPNGRYLLVETLQRPFSCVLTAPDFPRRIEIWDAHGKPVKLMTGAGEPSRRNFSWRADVPATLVWTEPGGTVQRNGQKVKIQDVLMGLPAPFSSEPERLFEFDLPLREMLWSSDDLAIAVEGRWKSAQMSFVRPANPSAGKREWINERLDEDRADDCGRPLVRTAPCGSSILVTANGGKTIFLTGDGASREGDRPFLDKLDTETGRTERLWRSGATALEQAIQLVNAEGPQVLISRQTSKEPPNFRLLDLATGSETGLTAFPNGYAGLEHVHREIIRLKRADGAEFCTLLHLPLGCKPEDGPFPTLMWGYPRPFRSKPATALLPGSPHEFLTMRPAEPELLLTQGYAVCGGWQWPCIVSVNGDDPNAHYVEQCVESAQLVVDELVRRGIAARERIAVGGRSHGANWAANMLVHTDLFHAGIAISGFYNRPLTPFGFQGHGGGPLWKVPDTYLALSPYMHADRITAPLLLIHGDCDDNVRPHDCRQLFNALNGLGRTVRLVMLPHEGHRFLARETAQHIAWEMLNWLGTHLAG